jgi:O-antigen/teichoic acid export membrane protein
VSSPTVLTGPDAARRHGGTVASSIGAVAAARLCASGLALLAGVAVARAISVADRGAYAVVLSVSLLAATLLTAGMDSAVLRSAGAGRAATALRSSVRRIVVVALLCALAAGAVANVPDGAVLGLSRRDALLSLAPVVASVGLQLAGSCLLGVGRVRAWAYATVLTTVVHAAAAAVVALAGRGSVAAFTLTLLAGQVAGLGVMAWALRDSWGPAESDGVAEFRRTARMSAPTALAQAAMLRVQVPLLQVLSTAAAVGTFAVAAPVVEALLLVPVAAGAVLLPVYRADASSTAAAARHAERVTLVTLLAALPLCLLAPVLVPAVYGDDYAAAVPLIWAMASGLVVFAGARVLQSRLTAEGRFRPVLISGFTGLVTVVVLQLVLTPSLGALGAALAMGGAYLASALPLWLAGSRGGPASPGGIA